MTLALLSFSSLPGPMSLAGVTPDCAAPDAGAFAACLDVAKAVVVPATPPATKDALPATQASKLALDTQEAPRAEDALPDRPQTKRRTAPVADPPVPQPCA